MKNYTKTRTEFSGTKHYLNEYDYYHRIDGPAYEELNGTKYWYINGLIHRIDGPAVEYEDGDVEYWIYGKRLFSRQFKELQKIRKIIDNDELFEFLIKVGKIHP